MSLSSATAESGSPHRTVGQATPGDAQPGVRLEFVTTPVMPMRESTSSSDAVLLIASVGRLPSAAVCSKSCSNVSSVVTTSWAGGRSSLGLFQHCSIRLERQWYSAGKTLVRLMDGRAPLAAAKKASNGVKWWTAKCAKHAHGSRWAIFLPEIDG